MKTFIAAALIGAIAAAPFELLNTRSLTAKDVKRQTTCPRELPAGNFEFPHLIVPISAANPDTAYGTSYNGEFTPSDISTIFNFDVPTSRAGQNCTLEFLFPSQDQLQTSSYQFSGPGNFVFTGYAVGSGATVDTTYNTQPPPGPYPPFPPINMQPGNAYTIDVGPCLPGLVSGKTSSPDSTLIYFQDYGECPIGVYVAYSG